MLIISTGLGIFDNLW